MPENVHQAGEAQGPGQWFQDLPIVTRYWLAATLVMTVGANFDVVSPASLVYSWPAIKSKLEVWRALSCFLYAGPFSFNTLICIYMLLNMSQQYEKGGPFNTGAGGGTADYVFALMFGVATILLTYPLALFFVGLPPMFCRTLVFYVLYVWSKRHPNKQANIYGVPMPAVYLPFAYIGLTILMGNFYMDMFHGMAVAHLYYFLVEVVPRLHGKDFLLTPQFLIDQFGIGEYRPERVEAAPPPGRGGGGAAAAAGRGHNWGAGGQTLGRG